jgi:hypothetical protein
MHISDVRINIDDGIELNKYHIIKKSDKSNFIINLY